jgi:hypothetical protein
MKTIVAPRGPSFAVPDFGVANKPQEWPRRKEKGRKENEYPTSNDEGKKNKTRP